MLYATRLADDVVLALVFDAETPFSTIRTQAGQLVNPLSITDRSRRKRPPAQQPVPASYDAPTDSSGRMMRIGPIPSIADILSDVPPPEPEPRRTPTVEENVFGTPSLALGSLQPREFACHPHG